MSSKSNPQSPAGGPNPATPASPRTWGFRFFLSDAVALAVFGAMSVALYRGESGLWWLVAMVAGHFFLFCNVFRVARRRELLWAGCFLVNAGLWFLLERLSFFNVMAVQLPVSVGVIAWEIRTRRYHGIFASRLNPSLADYLERRIS